LKRDGKELIENNLMDGKIHKEMSFLKKKGVFL